MSETDSMTPTAEALFRLLENCGPLTRQEILAESKRCEGAVDDALTVLKNRGFVDIDSDPDDLRQKVVELRDSAEL